MESRDTDGLEPTQTLLATLETLASECPALLGYAVRTLLASPARPDLLNLAHRWGAEPKQLAATVLNASTGLDQIERRRGRWSTPRQVINGPQLPPTLALLQLAIIRAERVAGAARRRRLSGIIRKLSRAHDAETQRARIQSFLRPPAKPVRIDLSRWISPLSSAPGGS